MTVLDCINHISYIYVPNPVRLRFALYDLICLTFHLAGEPSGKVKKQRSFEADFKARQDESGHVLFDEVQRLRSGNQSSATANCTPVRGWPQSLAGRQELQKAPWRYPLRSLIETLTFTGFDRSGSNKEKL